MVFNSIFSPPALVYRLLLNSYHEPKRRSLLKNILAIIFFSQFAFSANLPEFVGNYAFAPNKLQYQIAQHRLTVSNLSEGGKTFIRDLRSLGYSCQTITSTTFDCKKLSRQIPENLSVRQAVIEKYARQIITFQSTQPGYDLINDAPLLQEYEKNQLSVMGQVQFQKTKLIINDQLVKIQVTSLTQNASAYFYLNQKSELASQIQYSMQKRASQNPQFVIKDVTNFVFEGVWSKTQN